MLNRTSKLMLWPIRFEWISYTNRYMHHRFFSGISTLNSGFYVNGTRMLIWMFRIGRLSVCFGKHARREKQS